MSNLLLLFTDTFPFLKGEQYLNEEFKYLESRFSTIYVIPINFSDNKRNGFQHVNVININDELKIKKLHLIKNLYSYIRLLVYDRSKINKKNIQSIHHANETSNYLINLINKSAVEYDKVTIYSYWFYHSALIAGFIKKKIPQIKAISRAHMGDVYEEINNQNFVKLKLRYLDQVVTISDHAKEYLAKKNPNLSNKIITSRLGVKDFGINPINKNKKFFTIITCSSITKRKRLDKIVEALKISKHNIKWVHFGDGDQMSEIKKSAESLPSNIQFDLKGWVPNDQVLEYYRSNSVDLFINISLEEGIPVSIMEAISFGIPILAFNVYGLKEIVNDVNGILLPADSNIEEISNGINRALKSEFSSEKIKRNWSQNYFALKNYSSFIEKFLIK